MSTPHNSAKNGDIAKTVLLPGDPLRAEFIAEKYLKNTVCFNKVRNMLGFTGEYNGRQVSVMGTGMGCPSIGIYSYELIHEYGVQNLIRIGSCGAYSPDLKLYDIVIAMGASTDSNFASQYKLGYTFSATASYELLEKAVVSARKKNIDVTVGDVFTSDIFYTANSEFWKKCAKMGILAVDMESYALYCNAKYGKANAITLLTVSDSFVFEEKTTAEERQKSFTGMVELALDMA